MGKYCPPMKHINCEKQVMPRSTCKHHNQFPKWVVKNRFVQHISNPIKIIKEEWEENYYI